MTNDYLTHYSEHAISPVRQNITDIQKHFYVRKKLYETLGLTKSNVTSKRVLEIGPAGGYNSIYTASLKPSLYTLVEANKVGICELEKHLKDSGVDMQKIEIHNLFIEEFQSTEAYDLVICEGMLPCVRNNYEIITIMDKNLKKDGIMLLTCSDEISIFFDMARRLLANILLQREKETSFEKKITLLVDAFGTHLDTLRGFGRLKEDWCADNLLGDALYNTNLSVSDVINFLQERYSFYNLSPRIISDATWFKEVPLTQVAYNQTIQESFTNVWHNLLHYKVFDARVWSSDDTLTLREYAKSFIQECKESEKKYTQKNKKRVVDLVDAMQALLLKNSAESMIIDALAEFSLFLSRDEVNVSSIANDFTYFQSAFGRGQQYMSLIKEQD